MRNWNLDLKQLIFALPYRFRIPNEELKQAKLLFAIPGLPAVLEYLMRNWNPYPFATILADLVVLEYLMRNWNLGSIAIPVCDYLVLEYLMRNWNPVLQRIRGSIFRVLEYLMRNWNCKNSNNCKWKWHCVLEYLMRNWNNLSCCSVSNTNSRFRIPNEELKLPRYILAYKLQNFVLEYLMRNWNMAFLSGFRREEIVF